MTIGSLGRNRVVAKESLTGRWLLSESSSLRVQAAHASQPTIIVVRLTAEIFRDFRVRQNQETLFCQPLYHSLSDVFRLKRAGPQETIPLAVGAEQHPGEDALWTQT